MAEEAKVPTKVFISYSWDSDEHKDRVKQLADTLRNPLGIETDIDEYVRAVPPFTPERGWDQWMQKRIEWAEFVLIVCTETYKRRFEGDETPGEGLGVTWEGTIIRQYLYEGQLNNTKFIPIVFSSNDLAYVPIILKGNDKYIIENSGSLKNLVRRLRNEPTTAMPQVADLSNQIDFTQLAQDLAVTSPKESPKIQPPPVVQPPLITSPPKTSSTQPPLAPPPVVQPRVETSPSRTTGSREPGINYRLIGTSAVLAGIAVVGGFWAWQKLEPGILSRSAPGIEVPRSLEQRISAGEKSLVPQEEIGDKNQAFRDAKSEGVQALAVGNFAQAITAFDAAIKQYKNAPETLIYLNNARIGLNKAYTIAVAVPIGSNAEAALSILRGVAQAQDEINRSGGINGMSLRIVIVNDDDNKEIASEIASALANNPEVLGVVGHFSSGVTLATRKIYDAQQLPSISATSTSVALSDRVPGNTASYGFRVVPTDGIAARALADYMTGKLKKQQVAVFYEQGNPYSESLKKEFTLSASQGGGEVVGEYDINAAGFNAENSVKQAIGNKAQVLMLAPSSQPPSVEKALQIVQANNRQLQLLGGDAIYISPKILQEAGAQASGMVVAVFWDIDAADQKSDFPERSKDLWGAEVNWITAMTYDATQAFIDAMKQNTDVTRANIQATLSNGSFAIEGASGAVRFLPNGDRSGRAQLVKIQPEPNSRFGYDFVPIP